MKTIAVDFDGCLCESRFPEIGKAHDKVISRLLHEQKSGAKLILWTCREGERLREAVQWCHDHHLTFDAVNDNLPSHTAEYGNNCRKVFADEYWDDKSVVVLADDNETDIAYTCDGNIVCEMCGEGDDRSW